MPQFTAEEITATIFDPVMMPVTGNLMTRFASFFGRKAASEEVRHLSLIEAVQKLESNGMSSLDARRIGGFMMDFMMENMPVAMAMESPTCRKQGMFMNNSIDWSTNHYLGAALRSPQVDFTQEKEVVQMLRNMYVHQLGDALKQYPEWFQKQSAGADVGPMPPAL